jgi:hypothetical protein
MLAACGTVAQNPMTSRAERSVVDDPAEIGEVSAFARPAESGPMTHAPAQR